MKTLNLTLAIAVLLSMMVNSCVKSDPLPPAAYLNIVHFSPKTSNLYFKLEPNWLAPDNFEFRTYTGYLRAAVGTRTLSVYQRRNEAKLLTSTFSLEEGKSYSLFLIDTLSKMEALLLRDSTRKAGNDSVRIRFANFVPDVQKVDFYIQGNASAVATNIDYKSADNFFSMKSGSNVIFEVRASGTNDVLAVAEKTDLVNQNVYTIAATGYKSLSDDGKIIIGRMRHF